MVSGGATPLPERSVPPCRHSGGSSRRPVSTRETTRAEFAAGDVKGGRAVGEGIRRPEVYRVLSCDAVQR